MMPVAAALLLTLSTAVPPAPPPSSNLKVDLVRDGAIAAATLVGSSVLAKYRDEIAASSCRWCDTNQFDSWARDQLRWSDPEAGRVASNVAVVVVPVGLAGAVALSANSVGAPGRQILEDLVLMTQALGIASIGDHVPKLLFARLRPYATGAPPTDDADDWSSFWSGHSAAAFSVASAAGTIAKLRGYPHWKWIVGVGAVGASAAAYFRVAGDRHWTTDVLAGGAWGTAVGIAVPLLHVDRSQRATITPTRNGVLVAVAW
jgi:membrane-associated phospholipid phosphatase